jgi:hypothetical protein
MSGSYGGSNKIMKMIDIPRPRLIQELLEITTRGSVMVSGAPGIGKTWILAQLIKRCNIDSRPVTTLTAEDFQVSSLQEIYDTLGFSKPLPKLLSALKDPVLIIDGLDALRGEASQRAFRELIHEVLEQAPNAAIVASMRTFDLQESPELQRLQYRYPPSGRGMQKFVIGELSDAELVDASKKSHDLLALLQDKSTPLFSLLRNPFNLRLAFALLNDGIALSELKNVQSQVQLLESYWRFRVLNSEDSALKERLLRAVTQEMVDTKVLSVPETDVIEPGFGKALRALKSSEVLRKSVTGRLSFAHNILFDYAIARLLLDEFRLFDFIRVDLSRSLFFRPSLTLFFHRIWAVDRDLFWRITADILLNENLPERMRVIPSVVVAEALRDHEEVGLNYLRMVLGEASTDFIGLLLRAASAMRAFESAKRRLWTRWLLSVSANLEVAWINEVLTIVATLHSTMAAWDQADIGEMARNILFWEIQPPRGLNENQVLNLSSVVTGRMLPIIADTFESDPAESERAIRAITERVGSPRAASNEAFWLTNILSLIIHKAPALAESICLSLYSFTEESNEITSMGGGLVMPLTSTRRQDYSSALYGLTTRFKLFLETDPVRAARVAIKAVEMEVPRERKRDRDGSWETTKFRLSGHTKTYTADHSEIWDGIGSRDVTSLTLLDSALLFACEAAEEVRNGIVDEVMRFASLGISWKKLIFRTKFCTENLYGRVKELLFVPKFIAASEVTVDVGDVLKAAYEKNLVSKIDSERIQRAIVLIAKTKFIRRYETPSRVQERLLGCIPAEAVTNESLRRKVAKVTKQKRENRPFFRSSVRALAPDPLEEYRRIGVDPSSVPNAEVIEVTNKVREFEGRHLNAIPSDADCVQIEPALRLLHELLKSEGVSQQVAENARGVLYAAVNVISKNGTLGADSPTIALSRNYALEGSVDPEPVFDPKYHLPFDHTGWGSPSSRIEAVQALGHLIWNYFADDEIVSAFTRASVDLVPAARFQVARFLTSLYKQSLKERYWATLREMIEAETTSGVMLGLLESLQTVAGIEPEKTMDAIQQIADRGLPSTDRSETRQALVGIPVGLYAVQGNERAQAFLLGVAAAPDLYASEISSAIFTASHYLNSKEIKEAIQRIRARDLIGQLFAPAREMLLNRVALENSAEKNRKLLEIMDSAATRIVFSFGLPDHGGSSEDILNIDQRASLYQEIKPLLQQLLGFGQASEPVPLTPSTAYYLLQLMNGILDIDPVSVLGFAAATCVGGSYLNFQLDPSARDEAVKLVDHALADHKDTLKLSAESVGKLLDLFVKAGWSEALALTFRLDEAFR